MRISSFWRSALSSCVALAALGAPAFGVVPRSAEANQPLPTQVYSSGSSPVRIDSCRAVLIDKPGPGGLIPSALLTKHNFYIAAAVDFTNVSPEPLNAVRFVFEVQDTFEVVTQTLGLDWLGTFAPNVSIHARQNLAGTVGAVGQENTASSPTDVMCHVEFARYGDGRVWKWGDRSGPVAPGLYFPPRPAPSPTQ